MRIHQWFLIILVLSAFVLSGQEAPAPDQFLMKFDKAGVTSLRHANDQYDTDYIASDRTLGHVRARYKMGENDWREFSTTDPKNKVEQLESDRAVIYNPQSWQRNEYYADLELTERFHVEPDALIWTIFFRNPTHKPIVLGDIYLPLPFNTGPRWDKTIMYTQRVTEHKFISGHGSFIYWLRPNGEGPYLVMTPVSICPLFEPTRSEMNFAPAKLEYADYGGVYILAEQKGSEEKKRGGTWRQPQTSVTLTPTNSQRDGVTFAFKFRWAKDYQGVRDILCEEGLLDVHVAPGMTVPEGSEVTVSIRSTSAIHSVDPEFPAQTQVESAAQGTEGARLYKVKFARLGENKLTVLFGRNQYAVLEFFVTQPLETLIKKRSAFLVERHQHRNAAKWYDGLFSEWDMRKKALRGPEDTDGLADYILASDDPALCKAPYIAAKNVEYPEPREIEAVEYYLKNFVWGKLQMTDKERYPYALYGIDNWKINRQSRAQDRNGWVDHLWRAYDYPHITYLYLSMYRIAKHYPHLVHYLDADGYLERAFGTARGFYVYPWKFARWSANEVGNYNELVIAELMEELYAAGWKEKADLLRAGWEAKVEYFVNDQPDLFYSEYPFDPTAFESTGAFARYALEQLKKPVMTLNVKPAAVERFVREQLACNISTRGWLEPSYWQMGVEGNMRYMSQMGGWSILDYGLYYAADPFPYLRLGYASYLSSWALMNSGTPEANYGFWYPGKENDGAAGSAFVPQAYGSNWFGKQQPRGPWQYSGEIDLGFGAALRTAATIVADDPILGLVAYGGRLTKTGKQTAVIPEDGLRRRLHIIRAGQRFHLLLDRDRFARDQPIRFDDALAEISFVLEGGASKHQAAMSVSGSYSVFVDGRTVGKAENGKAILPLGTKKQVHIVLKMDKA